MMCEHLMLQKSYALKSKGKQIMWNNFCLKLCQSILI